MDWYVWQRHKVILHLYGLRLALTEDDLLQKLQTLFVR
jgi:hypothetical protein